LANHTWLSVKRNLRPGTATNVVLRALSRIIASFSRVSGAVFRLPDTVKSVSGSPRHHVTMSASHHVYVQQPHKGTSVLRALGSLSFYLGCALKKCSARRHGVNTLRPPSLQVLLFILLT
jgi:hypothetical protein